MGGHNEKKEMASSGFTGRRTTMAPGGKMKNNAAVAVSQHCGQLVQMVG